MMMDFFIKIEAIVRNVGNLRIKEALSITGCVIPKTLKMVLDSSLLNTQQYKVPIKGKVEQSRERSCALPYICNVVAIEKGAF